MMSSRSRPRRDSPPISNFLRIDQPETVTGWFGGSWFLSLRGNLSVFGSQSLLHFGEQVSELFLPRSQHSFIRLVRLHLNRNAVSNLEAESFNRRALHGMICYQSHLPHAEVVKYLRAYAVIARVHLVKPHDRFIGFDRILILFVHQTVRLELIDQTNAAPFLFQVKKHTVALACDYFQGAMKLPAGVISQ